MKRLMRAFGLLLILVVLVAPAIAQVCTTQVTVQSGDTLWDIARRCGTTVPAILETNLNIVEPSVINVGDSVTIPSADAMRPPQVTVYPQSVRPGDRIQVMANGFPLTTDVLISAGPDGSVAFIQQTVKTDRQGALFSTFVIPPTAALNGRWVIVIQTLAGQSYTARSFPFFIDEETVRAPTPQPTIPPGNLFTQTQIFLVMLGTDGSVGCGDSTTPYTISIEPTVAPLRSALNQLLTIGQQAYGYYNALGQSNLSVRGIDIESGVATIDLIGELRLGGVCDAPRIEAQLRQTALQYSTIDSVNILINGQPLAESLSER